jgi:hypothetical protein
MEMMGTMVGAQVGMYAALAMLGLPLVLYVLARWRAQRDPVVDPQLGIKLVLGYFAVVAFQLVLAGAAMFFYAVLSNMPGDEKSSLFRGALGLVAPGSIVLATHLALLRRTNQDQFPNVKRVLLGYNLFVTGTVGLVSLVLAFEALFGKSSGGEMGRVAGAMVLVYGSAWAAVGVHFGRIVLGNYQPPGAPPETGASTPASPAQPAGPALPPLGGGAFPPIEKK